MNAFFDIDFRLEDLDRSGDPLTRLNEVVPLEKLRSELEIVREKGRKSNAGRKPFDVVLMFKILILRSLYNLTDNALEYQISNRLSFMHFLGLALDSRVPDAKIIRLFNEELRELRAGTARKGQIIDASIISAPKQHNNRDENEQIKDGKVPDDWSENKKWQKDTYAK